MYDELVRSLRICAEGEHCDKCTKWELKQNAGRNACEYAICTEAADAIEELRQIAGHYEETAKDYFKDVCYYLERVPKWIPVAEPPKEDGWYQVYAPGYSGGSSSGLKNIKGNMYSAFKHGKWSIEVGYHKRPGCVKAWMPLPEPPKEE